MARGHRQPPRRHSLPRSSVIVEKSFDIAVDERREKFFRRGVHVDVVVASLQIILKDVLQYLRSSRGKSSRKQKELNQINGFARNKRLRLGTAIKNVSFKKWQR